MHTLADYVDSHLFMRKTSQLCLNKLLRAVMDSLTLIGQISLNLVCDFYFVGSSKPREVKLGLKFSVFVKVRGGM